MQRSPFTPGIALNPAILVCAVHRLSWHLKMPIEARTLEWGNIGFVLAKDLRNLLALVGFRAPEEFSETTIQILLWELSRAPTELTPDGERLPPRTPAMAEAAE